MDAAVPHARVVMHGHIGDGNIHVIALIDRARCQEPARRPRWWRDQRDRRRRDRGAGRGDQRRARHRHHQSRPARPCRRSARYRADARHQAIARSERPDESRQDLWRGSGMTMTSVRLLADDLTGALDTAAEFVGLCGPFDVTWREAPAAQGAPSLAIDSGTRERSKAESVEIVGRLAPLLQRGTIAYKKVDSLLRGAWAAELGPACAAAIGPPASSRRPSTIRDAAPSTASNSRERRRRLASSRRQSAGAIESWRISTPGKAGPTRCRMAAFRSSMPRATSTSIASSRWDGAWPAPVLWCGSGGLAGALARGIAPMRRAS